MLAFVTDMANLYGKEIKAICDVQFVKTLIERLKSFRMKRYETDINQQEQVNNYILLFIIHKFFIYFTLGT